MTIIHEGKRLHHGGTQDLHKFDNGYGASVIRGGMAYGGLELAVMRWAGDKSSLCYNTPITDDVLGYLSEDEIPVLLAKIEALPPIAQEA